MSPHRHALPILGLAFLVFGCPPKPPDCPTPKNQPVVIDEDEPKLVAENPRDATAFIQVRPPEDLVHVFLKISADKRIKQEYREAALEFATRLGSGSGFVIAQYAKKDKKKVAPKHSQVVTNRHVVEGTDNPIISFDGGETLMKGEIIYIDDAYDLAVISIAKYVPGLVIRSHYTEMEDVFALGYPGLNAEAMYQAARGSISNKCIHEKTLMENGSDRCWIQHTAAIDPGSSGGPLIEKDNSVIGVNALYVNGRHDTFMAVPAEAIEAAVKQAHDVLKSRKDKERMTQELQSSCYKLMSELASNNPDAKKLLPYISNRFIASHGWEAYNQITDPQIDALFFQDPYKAMQISLVLLARNYVLGHESLQSSERCEQVSPSDDVLSTSDAVRIKIHFGNGSQTDSAWRFERGRWRLSNI